MAYVDVLFLKIKNGFRCGGEIFVFLNFVDWSIDILTVHKMKGHAHNPHLYQVHGHDLFVCIYIESE